MNRLCNCHFSPIVSFEEYETKKFDKLHQDIVKIGRRSNNMLCWLVDTGVLGVNHDVDVFNIFKDSREQTYLSFQILTHPRNLYIISPAISSEQKSKGLTGEEEFAKFDIYDMETMEKDMNIQAVEDYGRYTLSIMLVHFKKIFIQKKGVQEIFDKYISSEGAITDHEKLFQDILSIPGISSEFNNCTVNVKMKAGKPEYMTAEAHTQDVDFKKRKETLGPHRKIEENASEDHAVSLKVTKKFKYD